VVSHVGVRDRPRVLGLVGLSCAPDAKDIEIAVLRHQLMEVRRQVVRPRYEPADRLVVATLAKLLPRDRWPVFPYTRDAASVASGVGGASLDVPGHRAGPAGDGPRGRRPGGADGGGEPAMGLPEDCGEVPQAGCAGVGDVGARILRRHRLGPAPRRGGPS
jgi:putative transposase